MHADEWNFARLHRTVDLRAGRAHVPGAHPAGWRALARGDKPARCRHCHSRLTRGFGERNGGLCGVCVLTRGGRIVAVGVKGVPVVAN